MARFAVLAVLGATTLSVTAASADPGMRLPTGRVILTIEGAITTPNRQGKAVFDAKMLRRFRRARLKTSTSWTKGRPVFEGVLVRDVLRAVGARGRTVTAVALNDYRIEIPVSDFETYDVLFATHMNGRRLTARDKGPIWVVYPRDRHRELQNQKSDARWIWQVVRLSVR